MSPTARALLVNQAAVVVVALCLLQICKGLAEPSVKGTQPGGHVQFERVGYFCADSVDSKPDSLVFNRVVSLR